MTDLVLSEDGHVEIPADIQTKLSPKAGDVLDACVEGGSLHLRPKLLHPPGPVGPKVDLSPGFGKGTGLFGSVEEIDDYIRQEPDSWA